MERHTIRSISKAAAAFCTLLLALVPAPAFAIDNQPVAYSAALACLTMVEGSKRIPDYPENYRSRKERAIVKVQLEFLGAAEAPVVKLLVKSGESGLDEIIVKHVKNFRVPCIKSADGPVRLHQQYQFDPEGTARVVIAPTRDADQKAHDEQVECIKSVSGMPRPKYPQGSQHNGVDGSFLVRLRFSAPDQPPSVEFLAQARSRTLRQSVLEYISTLRMPCLRGKPVDSVIAYKFLFQGDPITVLRDTDLGSFLGEAKDLQRPVFFDTTMMACPFDLRVTYLRPHIPNRVEQLDTAVDARQPLLDWLEGVTLDVKPDKELKLFGATTVVAVPCGKLDI